LTLEVLAEKGIGDLDQDARAITHELICTDGATMVKVLKDF